MVRAVPVSVVQPVGRLSSVSTVAVTAVTRAQLFRADVTKRNAAPVPPILIHLPTARPANVVKLVVVDERPVAVALMSPLSPIKPTSFTRAAAGGTASSVMPEPTKRGTVADAVVHANTPLLPVTPKPVNRYSALAVSEVPVVTVRTVLAVATLVITESAVPSLSLEFVLVQEL
jgi:hypothetical protein